jgi:hypothetical protein
VKVDQLIPIAQRSEPFRLSHEKFIPEKPGCYALVSATFTVLYLGLTDNLRRRMRQHRDNEEKTSGTVAGRAVLFYWREDDEPYALERSWLNLHYLLEGVRPVLNKIDSPVR